MGSMKKEVIILHGWTYSVNKWHPFIDLLKQKGVSAKLLKIPGLTEKINKVWTVNDYIEWLRLEIDPYSSSERSESRSSRQARTVILIGHSNGGRIALNFSVKYPNLVSQLVLIDSAGVYHDDLVIRMKRLIFKSIAKIAKKISNSQKLKNFLYKIVGEDDYKDATQNMKQTMLNLINSDRFLKFGNITIPTLIIWGKNDKIISLSDGKLMNELIKGSKLYIVENARHSPQFTNPKEGADIIYEYI